MASAVVTQTAIYERKRHDYALNNARYSTYEDCPIVAKRFAQALTSLGMTIAHVVKDTTQEYDETKTPAQQPSQVYQAHVVDPVYNIGIYINCNTYTDYRYNFGLAYWFNSGLMSDGYNMGNYSITAGYCFDAGLHTITKQSFGSMVRYIFPLSYSSAGYNSSGQIYPISGSSTVVGHYATVSGFKAANLFTGEEEPFGTYGVVDSNNWFLGTPRNTISHTTHSSTGHTSSGPQPSGGKTVLWQSPLYCGEILYDKINGGRLFSSSKSLPIGADFIVDGVTLRMLSTNWALELL